MRVNCETKEEVENRTFLWKELCVQRFGDRRKPWITAEISGGVSQPEAWPGWPQGEQG